MFFRICRLNRSHCNKTDVQLNLSMIVISGTVKSTPEQWVPVSCKILPPSMRRKSASHREWTKYAENQSLPIHQDITHNGSYRLKFWKTCSHKYERTYWEPLLRWPSGMEIRIWKKSNPDFQNIIIQILGIWIPGYQLSRRHWVMLNRLRTGYGHCRVALQMKNGRPLDCGRGHPLDYPP